MTDKTLPTFTLPDLAEVLEVDANVSMVAGIVHARCHEIALVVVRSGKLGEPGPECRVARGWADVYMSTPSGVDW